LIIWCSCAISSACVKLCRICIVVAADLLLLLLLLGQGPVRCLDAAGPWVVSGGQDDQLHIYDVKVRP
jgi:hypothetical protein